MPRKGEALEHTESSCTAKTRDGDLCKNAPMRGSRTCRMHGSATAAARAKAEERILMAADPAAATLIRLMRDKKVPPQVQLAAARDLLDRAGLSKTTQLQIALKPYEENIQDLFIDVEEPDEADSPDVVKGMVVVSTALPALSSVSPRDARGPRKLRAYR